MNHSTHKAESPFCAYICVCDYVSSLPHRRYFLSPWQKMYRDFRLQGVLDSTLNCKMYETVRIRLTVEEATATVREGGMQGVSMKDSDEEDN